MSDEYITERETAKGTSFLVRIRKHGISRNKTFKDKKSAKAYINDTLSKINKGDPVDIVKIKKTTLKTIFEEYLKHNKHISKGKQYTVNNLILEIGEVTLANFKSGYFEEYLTFKRNQPMPDQKRKKNTHPLYNNYMIENKDGELVRKCYAESSIRKLYYDIRTSLKWHANFHDYTFDTTPFDRNKAPKAWGNVKDTLIEKDDLNRLIIACDQMYVKQKELKAFLTFQYYSAMRSGESLLMEWEHIHIDEKEPYNSFILVPKENQKIADKEGAEDRKVPLRPDFYNFVKDDLIKLKKLNQKYVFGHYWQSSTVLSQRMKILCKNAELKDVTIHSFRHTACTWYFVNTNLSQIEISKITGHIELETLKRYLNLRSSDIGKKLWS